MFTDAAPDSAIAWGALALAYSVRKRAVPPGDRPGLDSRGRAAAAKALQLDPKEARGIAALLLLNPIYRDWANAELKRLGVANISAADLTQLVNDAAGSVRALKRACFLYAEHGRVI